MASNKYSYEQIQPLKNTYSAIQGKLKKGRTQCRELPLCGVWGRVSVACLTLACAMRGDRDSNPGHPDGTALKQTAQKKG